MTASQTGAVVCVVWLALIGVMVLLGRALSDPRAQPASEVEDREDDPCPLCRLEDHR